MPGTEGSPIVDPMKTLLVVLGTRPEAVKLAPVLRAAGDYDDWELTVCSTGQHRELLDPILKEWGIRPDIDLAAMDPGASADTVLARVRHRLADLIASRSPSAVVGQGDTNSVLATATAAHAQGVPFVHVEAGLRTGDPAHPCPEESNRVRIAGLTALHLAPTPAARDNLRREGVSEQDIVVTGNTSVDAARTIAARLPHDRTPPPECPSLRALIRARPRVLVTGHRREAIPQGLRAVCDAVRELARRHPEVDFVVPSHRNPQVEAELGRLRGVANVHVLPPLSHTGLIWVLRDCTFVISDSGGIQEEAPEFGKPVLVTRVRTERGEAVEQGTAVLVGYDTERLVSIADGWIRAPQRSLPPRGPYNPFGDGAAGERCVAAIRGWLGLRGPAVVPWTGPSVQSRQRVPVASSC